MSTMILLVHHGQVPDAGHVPWGDPVNMSDPYGTKPCANDPIGADPWDLFRPSSPCDTPEPIEKRCFADSFVPANVACGVLLLPLGGGGGAPAPAASCSISVAAKGTPQDGQNVIGLTNYSPLTNTLGTYSTIGRPGGGPQRRFFAVQIQASLSGDTNPLDWTPTQTTATSGTVSVTGRGTPVRGSIPPGPDNPDFGINRSTAGRFDWLDEPGFPNMQFGGTVTSADLTDTFTSTLRRTTGQSCSV